MMRNDRRGFTLIELLVVVVIIGLLASIAIPKFSQSKEKAYLSRMKTDLRNLITAQESYAMDNGSYYAGAIPNAVLAFNPTSDVTLTVNEATAGGWSATVSMPAQTARTCAVYVGSASPVTPAVAEGQIKCD